MLLPPGQKHFTVYVVGSLFGSVSVLYAVQKNNNCNRSSYFTLKWSSFTTATLYLLWLYLRYTQSHLAGLIFFQFRRQIFFGLWPGVKGPSGVFYQGSFLFPLKNMFPIPQALAFSTLLIFFTLPNGQSTKLGHFCVNLWYFCVFSRFLLFSLP